MYQTREIFMLFHVTSLDLTRYPSPHFVPLLLAVYFAQSLFSGEIAERQTGQLSYLEF